MRKSYGNTWWGKQWLNALNQIDFSNRLPRGRTYANKGLAGNIQIKDNKITAEVQGSRPRPYKVSFTVPPFSNQEKAKITEAVIENPMHLSSLLNRKLPPVLMQLCAAKGVSLFPASWNDIEGACSCPDWAVPCKHMASVIYLVANEIDQNPFLVFELHKFNLFEALKKAGYTSQESQDIRILSLSRLWEDLPDGTSPAKQPILNLDQIDFSVIPSLKEDLMAILSDQPVFFPAGNFKKIITENYNQIAKGLEKKSTTASPSTALDIQKDLIEDLEIILSEKAVFLDVSFRDKNGKVLFNFDKVDALTDWLDDLSFLRIQQYAPSLRGLWITWLYARQLAKQGAIIPQILVDERAQYLVRWIPALLNSVVKNIHDLAGALVPENILFYKVGTKIKQPITADFFTALTSVFLTHLVSKYAKVKDRLWPIEVIQLFFNQKSEPFNDYETKDYPVAIQLWLNKFYIIEKDFVPVIKVDDSEEGFSVEVAFEDKRKKTRPVFGLKSLLEKKQYADIRMDALRDLAMLSEYFSGIGDLVKLKGKVPLLFDEIEFVDILFKILPTIRLFGIKVVLPKALRKIIKPQLSMQVSAGNSGIVKKKSLVNLDELLNFDWRIALGDTTISRAEFLKMIKQFKGIVRYQNEYLFFDEAEIAKLIHALENPPELDGQELLQIALADEYKGASIELTPELRQLMDELLSSKTIEPPISLEATLRPYQQRGYEWLYKNTRLGFGSLLADDMGLGKTLQVITTLLKLKEEGSLDEQKALVVVPTTLLTNWDKEIKKFGPELITHIYHGTNRKLAPIEDADVLLTTYGVARGEVAKLQKYNWLIMVIDEAQNIKNPATAQTKAIKKLKVPIKVAMSGTPVENRMSEYWSVFDFANKGYLGTLKKFKDEYAKPIEADRDLVKLEKFKKITAPFIMRRVKSDKSIIKDLPEKIEQDQFCQLTPEQAAIYQNVVDKTLKRVETAEGVERKGLVLMLITALKQICNHPYQYLKKGDKAANLSGKTMLLFQLLQQILDNGEKTLIFTQYQQMGRLLQELLADNFSLDAPFLHGGISRKGRDAMVEDFQNNRSTRVMILSLKAGGTGLNLTEASNVIHYDLWWNPAVEAQATDRAYRIGQKRNVMVHRFITQQTFEEKINELLKSKKELANLTVANGEKWIGNYDDAELRELVSLRK